MVAVSFVFVAPPFALGARIRPSPGLHPSSPLPSLTSADQTVPIHADVSLLEKALSRKKKKKRASPRYNPPEDFPYARLAEDALNTQEDAEEESAPPSTSDDTRPGEADQPTPWPPRRPRPVVVRLPSRAASIIRKGKQGRPRRVPLNRPRYGFRPLGDGPTDGEGGGDGGEGPSSEGASGGGESSPATGEGPSPDSEDGKLDEASGSSGTFSFPGWRESLDEIESGQRTSSSPEDPSLPTRRFSRRHWSQRSIRQRGVGSRQGGRGAAPLGRRLRGHTGWSGVTGTNPQILDEVEEEGPGTDASEQQQDSPTSEGSGTETTPAAADEDDDGPPDFTPPSPEEYLRQQLEKRQREGKE